VWLSIAGVVLVFIVSLVSILQTKDSSRAVRGLLYVTVAGALLVGLIQAIDTDRNSARTAMTGSLDAKTSVAASTPVVNVQFGDSHMSLGALAAKGFRPFQGTRFLEDFPASFVVVDGKLVVSAEVRDETGNVIAVLSDNEWKVNPSRSFDRNYTADSLEVVNQKNQVVFQLQMLPSSLRLQARFFDRDGNEVIIRSLPDGTGQIVVRPPSNPGEDAPITPLFKYPSDQHLGEHRI
jgi:hypothetical protein